MTTRLTYLDNNATTRPDERVLAAMLPLLTEQWANASSGHFFGGEAAALIEQARRQVADLIGARDSEIVFTSGGTEADNAALRGVLGADPARRHVIISAIEHHAVLETADRLEEEGIAVTRVGVDRHGVVNLAALAAAIRADTALISIMLANNETGVIQPLRAVADLARARGVPVHTDAVNALGKMPVNVDELGVALLSLSAHKIYGPKGVGALYIRRGTPFRAVQTGGAQERKRRGGTLNTAGIVALGKACELLQAEAADLWPRLAALRDRLEREIGRLAPGAVVIGRDAPRIPNTALICFAGVPAEPLLLLLSEAGICASGGAACASGSLEPSHVLKAMSIDPHVAQGEVRFSLGRYNTDTDIERLLEVLPGALRKLVAANL
ncbi:MAG: aminotransferase class V-fold PLP-dependent enzyme [Planctomycetota bacterium]